VRGITRAGLLCCDGSANPGANDRVRCRFDASARATADGGTERRSETDGKESAANNLEIALIVQRSDVTSACSRHPDHNRLVRRSKAKARVAEYWQRSWGLLP
jgi:hypothetical protein